MALSGIENGEPLVRFDHIDKTFDGETLVIKDLNLDIAQGYRVVKKGRQIQLGWSSDDCRALDSFE